MKLSIIIPCYNEKNTILKVLKKVENAQIGEITKEIIIIDDYSKDGTRELLKDPSFDFKAKVVFHDKNMGKGACIKTGLKHISGDIVIIQDSDLEYDPDEYPLLLKPILDDKADVVYGSRFAGYQPHRVWYFWHYVVNKIITLLSNMLTNLKLTDMETCYKVFKASVASNMSLKENGFGFEPEFTLKIAKMHCRIYEVGISYYGRHYREGKKINWKDGLWTLWCLLRYTVYD